MSLHKASFFVEKWQNNILIAIQITGVDNEQPFMKIKTSLRIEVSIFECNFNELKFNEFHGKLYSFIIIYFVSLATFINYILQTLTYI